MSFFAKISDPAIGGTYMTLLNTVTNLGSKWPNALALYLLPKLTLAQCLPKGLDSVNQEGYGSMDEKLLRKLAKISCSRTTTTCVAAGGHCHIQLDGYTIETVVCIIIGVIWIFLCRDTVAHLQYQPYQDWMVLGKDRDRGSRKE